MKIALSLIGVGSVSIEDDEVTSIKTWHEGKKLALELLDALDQRNREMAE